MTNPILDILNAMPDFSADKQQDIKNNNKRSPAESSEKRKVRYNKEKEYNNKIKQELFNMLTKEQVSALILALNNMKSKTFTYPGYVTGLDNKKYKVTLTAKKYN